MTAGTRCAPRQAVTVAAGYGESPREVKDRVWQDRRGLELNSIGFDLLGTAQIFFLFFFCA